MFYRNERAPRGNAVPETGAQAGWQRWAVLVQRALEPGPPPAPDELLLVRDRSGNVFRPLEPPAGIAPRSGAVLILLYPEGDDLRLPLTVRSDRLPNHRGEVSLPGGATDATDDGPAATALRECHEELGVEPAGIEVWSTLSPIYIAPSNFRITPVVAFRAVAPELHLNEAEVSAVISVTLRELLEPDRVMVEQWNLRGADVLVPFFAIAGHKVWGATALVLSEFVALIRRWGTQGVHSPP
jgi:8-oxo-dGTP pyrophosphatase MutT (NUDIX family)